MELVLQLRDLLHDHLDPGRVLHDLRPGVELRRPVSISWGWPIIVGLILFVALSMSGLASAFPTAGGPYWWAHRLGAPAGLVHRVVQRPRADRHRRLGGLRRRGVRLDPVQPLGSRPRGRQLRGRRERPDIFAVFLVLMIVHALLNIYSSRLVAPPQQHLGLWHLFGFAVIVLILVFVPDGTRVSTSSSPRPSTTRASTGVRRRA